jgi:hypothetical protein
MLYLERRERVVECELTRAPQVCCRVARPTLKAPVYRRRAKDVNPRGRFSGKSAKAQSKVRRCGKSTPVSSGSTLSHVFKLHSGLGGRQFNCFRPPYCFVRCAGPSVCPNGAFFSLSQLHPLKRCAVARALRSHRGGRGRQRKPLEAERLRRRPGSPSGATCFL